ncbi:FecCD family ABC transporter permease [Moritella viscosa]|uniref:FecCD family ABC transporter permease n=1 Tax=Moritella viscosa TaxID=80854 RepID=UPI00091CD55A|nr:iron ABC transporter permease [Moritella viscosa]SHO14728.1 Iron(III) dicitrate transport system permease protein [Moritella viscosa]SHO18204.1 Iron(III) dicitrate transport system permease protein [Moritella viscosa]SHO19030.1 Iron(III) dicitrate transport system permease protein [Moritella viscosa]
MNIFNDQNVIISPAKGISLPIYRRTFWVLCALLALLSLSFICSLKLGSVSVSWADVYAVVGFDITLNDATSTIYELRLPRIMGAISAGALMALSGYLLQTAARNALADPGVLGLSDGAALSVIVMYVIFSQVSLTASIIASFLGVFVTALVVLWFVHKNLNGTFIVLAGIAVGAVMSAFSDLLLSSVTIEDMAFLMAFLSGSFVSLDLASASFLSIWMTLVVTVFLSLSRYINPLNFGYQHAMSLGVDAKNYYIFIIILAVFAMAPVIALVGSIGFIGLIATFLAKNIIGYRGTELGIVSMLLGSIMTLWADTLGRTLFAPIMINAGVFIALIGALFFILMTRYIVRQ